MVVVVLRGASFEWKPCDTSTLVQQQLHDQAGTKEENRFYFIFILLFFFVSFLV